MANFEEIIQGSTPVLVDFYADWCGPCKMISPVIKLDVDRNPKATKKFQIKGVPTLILFKNSKQVWRTSGVVPIHVIRSAIEAA